MFKNIRPWQLLVVAAAGWVNRDQQAIIHYLQEENRVLRSKSPARVLDEIDWLVDRVGSKNQIDR